MVARGMGCRESQAGRGSQPCPCERDEGETLVRRLDDGFRFALPILRIGAAWLSRRMGRALAKSIAPHPTPVKELRAADYPGTKLLPV